MTLPRRGFLSGLAAGLGVLGLSWPVHAQGQQPMNRFGLHGTLMAHPGQRDALAKILLDAAKVVSALPGCEIYFVSLDEKDATAIHVTEVWKDVDLVIS